ncbi:glycosyltransferase [Thermococcus thioreducens]|uniref:Glycosyl transferase n=1 Tax=Thermococcus thioreducens TaxID=277988 RepID=A0A0Q2S8B4_9EURY|nr:glycosyltransferase [Thermococcus thioreducens]ASJ11442.1 glycosyl transferase [Thermococcus thioreducens]KQH83459.1 glycosyl transferase [Thermococcus thioreducens]SEW06621.1 Glycosyltransferase, GT2 family [Thermococcus thioreducens]
MEPLVSIIIPTYNREKLLERAINSVLNQTFDNFEILIVDGARRKDTEDLVRSFGDGRLRYISQRGEGIANARNIGVKKAKGKLIAFLDDDDSWEPEKLERQIQELKNLPESYGVIYTAFNYLYLPNQKIIGVKKPKAQGNVYRHLLLDNITGTSTILVRKKCFRRAGLFREEFITCEDWDMWLRMAKFYLFASINEPLVNYSIHKGQFSFSKYLLGRYKMIETHGDIKHNPRVLSYHLLQIGTLRIISGDKKGIVDLKKAFQLNPFMKDNIGNIVNSLFDIRTRIYLMKFLKRI